MPFEHPVDDCDTTVSENEQCFPTWPLICLRTANRVDIKQVMKGRVTVIGKLPNDICNHSYNALLLWVLLSFISVMTVLVEISQLLFPWQPQLVVEMPSHRFLDDQV